MAAGLWTATTAIVKTVQIAQFTNASGDTLWHMYFLTLWSQLEEITGIIAACIPCIKARVEALLRTFGVISGSSAVEAPLNTLTPNSIHGRTEMSINRGVASTDSFRNQDTNSMENQVDQGESIQMERVGTLRMEQRNFPESGVSPGEGWAVV